MIKKSTFPSTITVVISFSLTWSVAGSNIIMHVTSQPANRLFTSWPCLNPSQSGKNYWIPVIHRVRHDRFAERAIRSRVTRALIQSSLTRLWSVSGSGDECNRASSKMEQRRKLPGESVGKTRFVWLCLFFFIWLLLLSVWSLFISL